MYSPRWGPGVAHRVQALAVELVEAEHREADLRELLERAMAVGVEVEQYLGAAVHDARAQGAGWSEVAHQARVSEATARAKWGPRTLRRQMRHRARQAAVAAELPAEVKPPTGLLEHRRRLGAAVSFLLRMQDRASQTVAQEAGISASCLSRLLAGQRVPDWPTVFTVVTAAGGRPEDFRLLWEWARGHQQPSRRSAVASLIRFHGALRGLQWAAGRAKGRPSAHGDDTDDDMLAAVLGGELVPDWATTHQLVQQLGGNPEQVRPLWEDVQYTFLLSHDFFPDLGVRCAQDLT
ncbi:XRE family transcriptional regulator [Streptomyces acidicola]|uniref:XRE family transcriptional regulator n=1 Tax=Streptomyces acidicola TaxID=2596892 RepID=UPI0037FB30AB